MDKRFKTCRFISNCNFRRAYKATKAKHQRKRLPRLLYIIQHYYILHYQKREQKFDLVPEKAGRWLQSWCQHCCMSSIISSHSGGLSSGILSKLGLLPDDTLINISVKFNPVTKRTEQIAFSVIAVQNIFRIIYFKAPLTIFLKHPRV